MTSTLKNDFAPSGILRASINLGNPILANWDEQSEKPFGVSVDIATELACRLDLPLVLVVFDAAGKSVEAVTAEAADFGFFAIDPLRGQGIAFTSPYVLIEGCYLVHEESSFTKNEDVDQSGVRLVVGKGSAYDLFLSREIKNATIVRALTSPTVVDEFMKSGADVAAGVRQQLEGDAKRYGGLRLLDGRFMVIQQAMGLPKSRSDAAVAYLREFVESIIRSGFVADSLERHNIAGASVAPAPV